MENLVGFIIWNFILPVTLVLVYTAIKWGIKMIKRKMFVQKKEHKFSNVEGSSLRKV